MGRKPLSVKPTKMYLFMSEIGNMNGLTRKTGKSISASIRLAIDYYMQNCKKGKHHDKN